MKVYLSHSIRGVAGTEATLEIMEANNALAHGFGDQLRKRCPELGYLYVPGDHDEFITIAYQRKYLTEDQILSVDKAIIDTCDLVIIYAFDNYISIGMSVELDYAQSKGIPLVFITKNLSVEVVAKIINAKIERMITAKLKE